MCMHISYICVCCVYSDGTVDSTSLASHGHLWWYPWQRDDWRVPGAGNGKAAEGGRGESVGSANHTGAFQSARHKAMQEIH